MQNLETEDLSRPKPPLFEADGRSELSGFTAPLFVVYDPPHERSEESISLARSATTAAAFNGSVDICHM
jgi:hypothetical protein